MTLRTLHPWLLLLTVTTPLAACSDTDGASGESMSSAVSAGAGARAGASSAPVDGLDFSSFDSALDRAISDYNATTEGKQLPIHGASAIVVTKDRGLVHSKGYGEFAADRLYLIASSSKILSVGVLMRLADQGKLDIRAPISTYLGDKWGAHKLDVSVAQLVSNSSGLPSLSELVGASSNLTADVLTQYGAHFCQYMPAGALSDCGRGIYSDDQPGNNRKPDQQFRYGGSQWQLAGALAEAVSGKSWADLIQETYVKPCEVPSLAFTNPFGASSSEGSSPLGYPSFFKADKANAPNTQNPSIEGGAYITAPDYAKLLLLHLREGKCGEERVLSAEAVKTMQTDRVAAYGGVLSATGEPSPYKGYGLGWWIADHFVADPGAYGAYPLLELERGYGAMILFEVSSAVGSKIALTVKPTLDAIIDAAAN